MECNNSPFSQKVVDTFDEIIKYLKELGFIVKFHATDGDISFDYVHNVFFEKHVEPNLSKSFIEIVDICSKADTIPLSDLLHLLKGGRARMINHLIMLDINEIKCWNTQLFQECVELGAVFTDKISSGSMKNDFIFQLFSLNTFVETMRKGKYDASYYILPYIYILENLLSPVLSLENRLHYNSIVNAPNYDLFQQRFHSTCIVVLYADKIFLSGILNTNIGIVATLIQCYDNLTL